MAEVAGLVIGGITLTAIFDQCITIIKYVDSGMNCSNGYQDAALMLTLLGCRLNRWERSLRDSADLQTTNEEGEEAKLWLEQIRRRLEEAEKLGERYTMVRPAAATTTTTKRSMEVARMIDRLRGRVLLRAHGLSVSDRARWAIFDEDKMNNLVEKLDKLVRSLEQIFPSFGERRVERAKIDAVELLNLDDTAESSQTLEALRVAAAKVDKDFDVAASASSHTYRDIKVTGNALVNMGDFYSPERVKAGGSVGQGSNNTYDGIRITGESKVIFGGIPGGKSIFEMQ